MGLFYWKVLSHHGLAHFTLVRLHLKVNPEKTVAGSVMNIKFLGHSFYAAHSNV